MSDVGKPFNPKASVLAATRYLAALEYSEAWHAAVGLGHDMELGWEDVTALAWVAMCRACKGYLCLDMDEEGAASFGRASGLEPCAGAPPRPPADRRDPMNQEAATPNALIPVERKPMIEMRQNILRRRTPKLQSGTWIR